MQRAIKEETGDCGFVVQTEYNSVDDATKDINPGEINTKLLDLRINSTKYKLKKDDEPNRQNKADSSATANNITNS